MKNTRIMKKKKSSQFKGVCFNKYLNKWQANIMYKWRPYHLGVFINEIDAAMAYDNKAREFFGKFANLNFPD